MVKVTVTAVLSCEVRKTIPVGPPWSGAAQLLAHLAGVWLERAGAAELIFLGFQRLEDHRVNFSLCWVFCTGRDVQGGC